MFTKKWWIAAPLAVLLVGATARGSTIRDEAGMFSPKLVDQAAARLDRLEKATKIPVVIETTKLLPELTPDSSKEEMRKAINQAAERKDERLRDAGIYILISRREHLISQPLVRSRIASIVPEERRDAIRMAFINEFKQGNFDEGLKRGVEAIEQTLGGHRVGGARAGVPAPVGAGAQRGRAGGGGSLLSTFLLIGLGIFAVLILLRVLGGLFGRSAGTGYPGRMGPMGGRPGMGPGGYYGGAGYGGRGGGFFSGLLGGLGGAMAGNWLYDQMSGRHGGMTSAGAGYPDETSIPDQGDSIIGAEDHGGQGGDWGDGGSDTGGGDWGGGGGGDWGGGGGGDWGGGGGDWGGGGGGDW